MMFCFLSSLLWRFVFCRLVTVFYIFVDDSNEQSIFHQIQTTNQIIVISILQNLSHIYFSHYNIIKFISFVPIYYAINPSVVSFSMVFNDLVLVIPSIYC